jgi:glycosyltransferase involved in cell wall biosynthesis
MLEAALSSDATGADFATAMRQLHTYAQGQDLSAALASEDAVTLLVDAWRAWPPGWDDPNGASARRPTLGDAALVTTLLEHMLRPLSHRPIPCDLVHCASNGLAGLVALGAKWTDGTPVVVSEHGVYLRERYLAHRSTTYGWAVKSAVLRLTRAMAELVYAEADAIVPGNVYNRRWQVQGGADPHSITTVYNGVNPDEFPQSPQEPEEPTLVFVGRIDPIKDLENLVRAFALVVEEIPEARLRIFGVAPERREDYLARCRALVAALGLDGSATFEGRAPSASDAYSAGQVVVLSSISEGFPYTVIEAMSSGRATASTDVGGVAEAVGETGLVVPARNPVALAEACVTLLRDSELRRVLGAAARERILTTFTLQRSMDALGAIYDDVCRDRSADVRLDAMTSA